MNEKQTNFEEAFSPPFSGCSGTCDCGRLFYDSLNHWDFDEGEFEEMEKSGKATALMHAVRFVEFGGRQYVDVCGCWKDEARKIINFIDSHATEIAKYLNAERARKISEAELVDVIED